VHTLRPKTHWRRFQFPLVTIIEILRTKITDNHWRKDYPRQRQQYWFQGFKAQLAINNPSAVNITFKHLKGLLVKNIIAATHSLRWFQMIAQSSLTYVPTI
jgi:hypothetical protein